MQGLFPKYNIQKVVLKEHCVECCEYKLYEKVEKKCDGCPHVEFKSVDKNAEYFVLRLDKDPHARKAALAYADSVYLENQKLADDLRLAVKVCELECQSKDT